MPTITLTLPVAATDIDAGPMATNFSDLQALLNGGLDADNLDDGAVTAAKVAFPYIAFTPTWTSSGTAPAIGDAVVVARYVKIGKQVHFWVKITFGATSTFGTGTYAFALPVAAHASVSGLPFGVAVARDSSTGLVYFPTLVAASTTTCNLQQSNDAGAALLYAQTVPWTWANADFLYFSGSYEAA